MKMKRFLALLLSVIMVLGMMPMTVFAAEHTHDYTSSYTHIDGSKQHYGVCSCGDVSTAPADCIYPDEVPGWSMSPNESREGKRTWECTLCHGEWEETVPAHKCTHNDIWEQDDYSYHCTYCVYPGCGAWMGEQHTNYMTGWVHEDATTLKNSCTRCGYFNSTTVESSFVLVEAKGATCSSAGNINFYICEHCDKYFADETCQKQYNPAEVFINPTAHNYVDGVCTECGAKVTSARFEQTPDEYFGSEDDYLYVFVGMGNDGKLYAMGEATGDGRRYGVEIPGAQIDPNGVITLTPEQAEFMLYEYYFENGSGASTTSTFTVDGGYMTIKNGKIYVFPKSHLDDPENPRPIDFDQADYGDDSGLGSVDADDYDPSTYTHTYEYMTFNPETLCFEACVTEQNTIYLYRQICDHENGDVEHYEYLAATCTEQGTREYWYCSKCFTYFSNAACTKEYEFPDDIDPNDSIAVAKYFQINALCHKFAENSVCEHCAMKRNVYKQVSTLEQFDQLSGDAYYIIVFKDGNKTYAAYIPDRNAYDKMVSSDSDGDGVIDLLETDANANGIPDIIEEYIDTQWGGADENEDGTTTADEYKQTIGSCDEDEDVDIEDYKHFFSWYVEYLLSEEFWEENAINHSNIVEVTVAADGSITIIDEGAMEFQMMPSGIWGGQEYDDSELEYENIKETDRLRAAWVPNWWIANYGTMGEYSEEHFLTQNRWFGDYTIPGIVDNKNWKISFNEDGTALLVSTWTDFDDSAALQLIKYTDADGNERITMVGCYGYLWENSDILSGCTVISGAYLYASEPVYDVPSHTCDFGDWVDDKNGDTHTRTCKDPECDKTETEPHDWDDGVQVGTPTCTEGAKIVYTCGDCGATYEEDVDNLGHDWGEWTDDGESSPTDTHSRTCKRNCGVAAEIENHNWSRWTPVDDNTHKKTCSTCNATRTATHNWAEGVVAKEPTEFEEGLMTYTCGDCAHTKGEPIPKLNHNLTFVPAKDPTCTEDGNVAHYYCGGCQRYYSDEAGTTEIAAADVIRERLGHDWSEWTYDSVDSHIRNCKRNCGVEEEFDAHNWGEWTVYDDNTHRLTCSICHGYQEEEHDWDNGVETVSPTCYSTGVMTYTCGTCGHTKTEEIPMTEHTWTDWAPNGDENHKRDCLDDNCDKFETEDHEWDDGVITTEPTCKEKGVKTFTCQVCMHTKTEDLPKTDHQWTDWSPNGDGTHTRACRCNANETEDCTYDAGVVTTEPTHTEKGVKTYTCTTCGHTYTEGIPEAPEHEWGEWVINKLDEANTHIRFCICNESQTAPHNFDEGVVTEPATHTSKGIKTFTCTDDCGYSYTEEIPMTPEHEWTNWSDNGNGTHTRSCRCNASETENCSYDAGMVTKQPTHYEEGEKTYTCTVCGAKKTESIAKTTTHEWSDWAKKDDASHIRECKCGEAETKAHNFDAGVVTKEATHLETGIKKFTCTDCGFVREDTITKTTEHTFGEWQCEATVVGKHYRECACGERETGDCTYNAGVVTIEPTYESTGTKSYTCTVCGGTKTETLDMLVKVDEIVSPDNSKIKISVPEGSNAVLNENTVIKVEEIKDAISEDVKDNVQVVVGNDNAEVLVSYDISMILDGATVQPGGKVEVTLPALENASDFDALQVVYIDNEGNVTLCETRVNADGTITFVTDHFSQYAIVGTYSANCEHEWDSGVVNNAPTCKDEGVLTYTCVICGGTKTETIAKTTEHTYDNGAVTTAPTCTAEGVITYTCTVCDHSYTEAIAATGHTYVGGECACGAKEEVAVLLGDVNGDGQINTRDAKLIMQYELGLIDETKLDLTAADVNGDGQINTRDAKLIMQFELGIIPEFPIAK